MNDTVNFEKQYEEAKPALPGELVPDYAGDEEIAVGDIVRIRLFVQPEDEPYAGDFIACRNGCALGRVTHIDTLSDGKRISCDFPINQEWHFDEDELAVVNTDELVKRHLFPTVPKVDSAPDAEAADIADAVAGIAANPTAAFQKIEALRQRVDNLAEENEAQHGRIRMLEAALTPFARAALDGDVRRSSDANWLYVVDEYGDKEPISCGLGGEWLEVHHLREALEVLPNVANADSEQA